MVCFSTGNSPKSVALEFSRFGLFCALLELAKGVAAPRIWPIVTGPVEGACKNLIKDRMERSACTGPN
jgi:hypothetical protein